MGKVAIGTIPLLCHMIEQEGVVVNGPSAKRRS
jgi:hypothetical protein